MSSNFLQIGTWQECYETALKAVGEPTNFTSIETQQGG